MIGFKIEYIDEKFNVKQLCTLEWAIKKFRAFETTLFRAEKIYQCNIRRPVCPSLW